MKLLSKIKGICKTIYFNFYYLPPTRAMQFPIKVHESVIIGGMGTRRAISVNEKSSIKIGFGQSFGLGNTTYWKIGDSGTIVFDGNAIIGRGSQIIADGEIIFGQEFYCNANCIINSGKKITFGEKCLIGWSVEIIDGDGHKVFHSGDKTEEYKPVIIGNHVWIGSNSMVLKGASIPDNSIIAADSCTTKSFNEPNVLIVSNKVIKTDIDWER